MNGATAAATAAADAVEWMIIIVIVNWQNFGGWAPWERRQQEHSHIIKAQRASLVECCLCCDCTARTTRHASSHSFSILIINAMTANDDATPSSTYPAEMPLMRLLSNFSCWHHHHHHGRHHQQPSSFRMQLCNYLSCISLVLFSNRIYTFFCFKYAVVGHACLLWK